MNTMAAATFSEHTTHAVLAPAKCQLKVLGGSEAGAPGFADPSVEGCC